MKTICGASAYQQKYYFNPEFAKLPGDVQERLKAICIGFTEENSGVFTIDMDETGEPSFSVRTDETDLDFDEIGAELSVRRIQKEEEELMKQLALFYRVFFLGESLPEGMS